jgi:hypothetical protein
MTHTNQKEYEFEQIMNKYMFRADQVNYNKEALHELINDAYRLGLKQGWALEQEIHMQIKEPL